MPNYVQVCPSKPKTEFGREQRSPWPVEGASALQRGWRRPQGAGLPGKSLGRFIQSEASLSSRSSRGGRPRKFEMADGLPSGGGLGLGAMAPERTNWAAEEEPEPLEKGLFQDEESCSDCSYHDKPVTSLQSFVPEGKTLFPEIFQTSQLLFYERFRAYQDYILADCKASEVREFTAEFLEKVLEPSGWRAVWHTNVFEVLVELIDNQLLKTHLNLGGTGWIFMSEPQLLTAGSYEQPLAASEVAQW
uniref:SHC SH2 domain-binding protein 1 n=1 Tax=Ictidomys tridecemlineatus TaxID=43179 RepID=UPI001A9ED808|nr:SHC SH2 domain-binding protein 1 [Ictidomys tridecemlineatus]